MSYIDRSDISLQSASSDHGRGIPEASDSLFHCLYSLVSIQKEQIS